MTRPPGSDLGTVRVAGSIRLPHARRHDDDTDEFPATQGTTMAQAFSDIEADAFYAQCNTAVSLGQWSAWRAYINHAATNPTVPQTWPGVSQSLTYGFYQQSGRAKSGNWWQAFAQWILQVVGPLTGPAMPMVPIPPA